MLNNENLKSARAIKAQKTLTEEALNSNEEYREILNTKDVGSSFIIMFIVFGAFLITSIGSALQFGFDKEQFIKNLPSFISNIVSILLVIVGLIIYYKNKLKRTKRDILLTLELKLLKEENLKLRATTNQVEKE